MASLFDIKADILKAYDTAIDPETGEIVEESAFEALEELQMAFDEKAENIACWIKNLRADAEIYKQEKLAFAERQKRAENKANSLANYLSKVLQGQKREYQRAAISFRKSDAVIVDNLAYVPEEYLVFKDPDVDKAKVKKDLKAGMFVPGARLEERQNIQIK